GLGRPLQGCADVVQPSCRHEKYNEAVWMHRHLRAHHIRIEEAKISYRRTHNRYGRPHGLDLWSLRPLGAPVLAPAQGHRRSKTLPPRPDHSLSTPGALL